MGFWSELWKDGDKPALTIHIRRERRIHINDNIYDNTNELNRIRAENKELRKRLEHPKRNYIEGKTVYELEDKDYKLLK